MNTTKLKKWGNSQGILFPKPILEQAQLSVGPLHVTLDERTETQGAILCEQVKSLDAQSRHIKFLEKLPEDLLEEVLDIV